MTTIPVSDHLRYPARPVKSSRSILIVEDEEIIRTTLREFLTGEGYWVADAGTVADALKLARQRDFDDRENPLQPCRVSASRGTRTAPRDRPPSPRTVGSSGAGTGR